MRVLRPSSSSISILLSVKFYLFRFTILKPLFGLKPGTKISTITEFSKEKQ